MAREFLTLVTESAYKVPTATPVLNADKLNVRLSDGNAFAVRPAPQAWTIRSADSRNRRVLTGSQRTQVQGRLQTVLYYAQAPLLLKWALQPVNAAQDSPWDTTEPPNDLASMACYHALERDDGSLKRRLYLGGKVTGGELTGDNGTDLLKLSLDLVFSVPQGNTFDASSDPDAVAFPEPAFADYPTDPVVFQDSAGAFKVGSIRTNYSSFRLTFRNMLDQRFDEGRFLASARLNGRDIDFGGNFLLKPTPDDRASYEAVAALDCQVQFVSGSKSILIDFFGRNFISADADATPLEKRFESTLTIANYLDGVIGSDLNLTFSGI